MALFALYRLLREWQLPRGWALAFVVVGGVLTPCVRIIAGSPSVDALYTGLGLWFIAATVALWRTAAPTKAADIAIYPPRWVIYGLLLPALLLPLIRYHAVILILPVLLVLLILRPRRYRALLLPLIACLGSIAFNYAAYWAVYQQQLPSVAEVQVRCGLEYRYHMLYPDAEALYEDYADLCRMAHSQPLVPDYTWKQLIKHTLSGWLHFLRRPAIALALACVVLAPLLRIKYPRGFFPAVLWITAYTLSLSVAYYTPRAAALPVLVALAAVGAVLHGASERFQRSLAWLGLGLLIAGNVWASQYARLVVTERWRYSAPSRRLDRQLQELNVPRGHIACTEARLVPLHDNPWCLPYSGFSRGWMDDPAIPPVLLRGVKVFDSAAVSDGIGELPVLIITPDPPCTIHGERMRDSQYWESESLWGEFLLYTYRGPPSGGGA